MHAAAVAAGCYCCPVAARHWLAAPAGRSCLHITHVTMGGVDAQVPVLSPISNKVKCNAGCNALRISFVTQRESSFGHMRASRHTVTVIQPQRTCCCRRHTPVGCCWLPPCGCRRLRRLRRRGRWVGASACCCTATPVGCVAALCCCQDCACYCSTLTLARRVQDKSNSRSQLLKGMRLRDQQDRMHTIGSAKQT